MEFNSDHVPVLVDLDTNASRTILQPRLTVQVNWQRFRRQLTDSIPLDVTAVNKDELDEIIQTITTTIAQERHQATTIIKGDKYIQNSTPELMALLAYKRQVRRRYQQQRRRADKTELNYMTKKIHALILDQRIRQLDNDLQEAIQNNKIWNIMKRLKPNVNRKTSAIITDKGPVFRPRDKSQAIANVLQDHFRPNDPRQDYNTTRRHMEIRAAVKSFLDSAPLTQAKQVTVSEVKKLIKLSKSGSAPGPDGISYETLKNLPHHVTKIITSLYNTALSLMYFPRPWKSAHIISIPKPGKSPLLPQNRRPISLLCTLGKIYERIILNRIKIHALEVTPDTQFGFVPNRSTILQLMRLANYIRTGLQNYQHTAALFLDVEKAYDSVWIPGLIYKLIRLKFPDVYIHILASYLKDRSFQVKMEGELSTPRRIRAGVPQGSVLAPTLFNMFAADMPTHENSQLAQYADDTALYSKSYHIQDCVKHVTQHLKLMTQWCNRWRIKLNEEKTQYIVFTRRRPTIPTLTIGNKILLPEKSIKYLGIHMDKRLNWKKHLDHTKRKATQRIHQLYPIFSSQIIPIKKKIHLYKAIIRPAMMYGAPVWSSAPKRTRHTLQVQQNKIARISTGADRYTSTSMLRDIFDTPYIEEVIDQEDKNIRQTIDGHTNPLIRSIILP